MIEKRNLKAGVHGYCVNNLGAKAFTIKERSRIEKAIMEYIDKEAYPEIAKTHAADIETVRKQRSTIAETILEGLDITKPAATSLVTKAYSIADRIIDQIIEGMEA
jgi:hypothetical protein